MASSKELRQKFLDYFKGHDHTVVRSAPLLPKDDPTLLFVNAGMVPFKDIFTGQEKRQYTRATSSQKCVRAGGKHNDLENVGRTARHHTFFEMLGNFSFGDYFKEEACKYAWEFLTKEIGLDVSKLSVTVFGGEGDLPADEEAEKIWHEVVGVPKEQISRCGAADNFWSMGDTGACGPCTEIHYKRELDGHFGDDKEGDENLEVWNLVFMQYERHSDGSLTPLPAPCVDTGMGLERLCLVVNELDSNYDTDLFRPLIQLVEEKSGKKYESKDNEDDVSMRVIADHARATCFLMADGILPSNEGRGYVLRRIMRRGIRHGKKLGFDSIFFSDICTKVVDEMGAVYPELVEAKDLIIQMTNREEETFRKTLDRGLNLFEEAANSLSTNDTLGGKTVFKLYETFGFPVDLTETLADERNLKIDWDAFNTAKKDHEKASASTLGLKGVADIYKKVLDQYGPAKFIGDHKYECTGTIQAIIKDNKLVDRLSDGEAGELLFDQTAFYGESGGQMGDKGSIRFQKSEAFITDVKKPGGLILLRAHVQKGSFQVGDKVDQKVDKERRLNIMRHHSATHLLHSALRKVLGKHVTQKGSLVAPDRLRFDYSHFEGLKASQVHEIENLVNGWVLENHPTEVDEMSFDDAKDKGAMALFGEKYGDKVRVVEMGNESTELCGGTHVNRTGDVGFFKITSDGPLASGVRRLEAVAGSVANEWVQKLASSVEKLSRDLSVSPSKLPDRINQLQSDLKSCKQELAKINEGMQSEKAKAQAEKLEAINGTKILAENLGQIGSIGELRQYADKLRHQMGSGIVALGGKISPNKCMVLVAVTEDLTSKFHAGNIVKQLAEVIGGRGGGRPDFAQAGGPGVDKLDDALAQVKEMVADD